MAKLKDHLIGLREQREKEYGGRNPIYNLLDREDEYLYERENKNTNGTVRIHRD